MKINKNVFICALLVLMLLVCVNAVSADESLNETLGTDAADEVIVADAPSEELSDNGDTYVVDANGDGDYTSISDAVSHATGGETIFVKNGQYIESQPVSIGKSLSIIGESRENVIISGGSQGVFTNPTDDSSLKLDIMLKDLTIKDVTCTGSYAPVRFYYSDINLDVINCTFTNCDSKSGAMQVGTTTSNIDGCRIINCRDSQGGSSSSTGIAFTTGGTHSMKNCEVNGSFSDKNNYAAIYFTATSGTLDIDNLTIVNCQGKHQSLIRGANGNKITIRNSIIANNTLNRFNDYQKAALFFVGKNNAEFLIEQSIIANNTFEDEFVRDLGTDSISKINYCNIYDNSRYTHNIDGSSFDLEANWWGSSDKPADVSASTWVVEDNGEYTLNTGDALTKVIPGLTTEDEPIVLPEGTIYISESGSDENDGLSQENAIATFAHAVEIIKARENKTATVYVLNGEYTTDAIDIGDDEGISLSIIGQEKGGVVIHGTGAYVFDVYGDNLVWNFKNIDFDGLDSTSRTSAVLVLYSENGNFTIDSCNFRNINSRLGAIAIGNDNGNTNVTNCIIEDVTGSASSASILTVNGDGKFILDNVVIKNCRYDESVASSSTSTYLRSILYLNTYEADVTISNSEICNNDGPMMSLLESRCKLTIINTTIADNVVDTSVNGANGGDVLVWASNDNSNININHCIISNNTIAKSGKGLFHNQRGTMSIEYSDISKNTVDKFIGSTGTITANNNWWGTNDQPDSKVDNWVIMNVEADDSDLAENNKLTLTIDFNHVKTSSGTIEELAGGEIPKDSYTIDVTAQNGDITPSSVVVNKGEVKTQTFTVTEVNDVITLNCDGDVVNVTIEGIEPSLYDGIIYVTKTGDNNNNGSIDAPVADLTKAIELANSGSGQIVIGEGTYVGYGYQVTKDLNITGEGEVILDADGQGGLFATGYPSNASQIILNNLVLAGANANYGQAINSYADELILNNVSITNNPGSGSLIIQSGKLTMNNCVIANHNGATVIDFSGNGDLIINNTLFENNTVTNYAIVYSSSYSSRNAIVENTTFRNNTGQLGIFKVNKKTTVKDSKFIDNTNKLGYGGAISDFDSLTVTNSIFINNKADKSSGAINVGFNRDATITHSTFINNTANNAGGNYHGDAISNSGRLTINYCVLLTNAENSLIYSDSENDVNAQYNWWGTNDNPESLNGVGTYEDDWDEEVNSVIDSSNWVYMNVTTDMIDDALVVGDTVEITVDFNNYIDSSNALQPLAENIPEVDVSASAINGDLDNAVATTSSGVAKFVYSATVSGEDVINITSADATELIPIFVDVSAEEGIIYVSPNGDDSNDGLTKKHAVKTIAHAIEIAAMHQIVLLPGVHATGDLGGIYEDLNITGEGKAIIDAGNNNRILYVGSEANVVITNVIMINGYSIDESGALLGNSNKLTLINCTLANSSAGQNNGGAVFNVGKLTVINTIIANCSAKQGGAIFSQSDDDTTRLDVINSTFENNVATGYDMNGGGAIYAQRSTGFYQFTLNVDNSTFVNNKADGSSSGGAIALVQLDATSTIKDSKFIANHANGKTGYGGGAIYVSSASNYYKYGTMTITGSLFENNTCGENGGAIYGRITTINVANSVLINNSDANGLAVYGYKSDSASPTITLNDNWWGSNDSPKDLTGGNNRYKPTLNRWAILTVDNDSAIEAGNAVKLTVSINNYTTGSVNGTMSKPITVKRDVTIRADDAEIKGTLENGEFTYDYTIPENIRYLSATVDNETVVLLVISSQVKVEVDNITAKKYEIVNVVINVTGENEVNSGVVELYADTTLIDTIPVSQGKAIKDIVISCDIGTYELIAKFVDESGLFDGNQSSATLTVSGKCELVNDTFFNFFDLDGVLREEIDEDVLVFHGDFSGLGVDKITINRPITISGDNAVLYDIAYSLDYDDITLANVSLMASGADFTSNNGAVVYVGKNGIEVNNVTISYTALSDKESFGIYVSSAEGFKLMGSEIYFDGNNNAELVHQAALIILGSSDVDIEGNLIDAALPARNVAYNYYNPELNGIFQDLVLGIGIQDGSNINFIDNEVIVDAKSAEGTYATLDSFMADSTENLVIRGNNFTQTDFTGVGKAGYSNVVDLYNFNGVTIENNNILINTTTGEDGLGTAYPIQATGPYSGLLITKNNLTAISKGPALGIYSQNYDGITDSEITFNNINVTGYATNNEYALVSGMELQDTYAKVYNNTIYSQSISTYDENNKLFGISYAQYTALDHKYDIRNNTIFTEGKYAVYIMNAKDSNVTENYLIAKELKGDDSVSIGGENNIVKDNLPANSIATVLSGDDLEMSYKDGSAWTVTLTDANGNAIEGATVKIGVAGKVYNRVTDENGAASLPINLISGTYEINATFDGDETYEASFVNATVTVNKAAATLSGDDLNMSYKDGSAWTVTLTDPNGDAIADVKVKFDISGKTYYIGTDDEGVASLPINLQPGTYEISASFSNSKYVAELITATITVDKLVPVLSAEDLTMAYKDGSAWNVTLTDANGNAIANTNVKFSISGATYNIKTNADGVAGLPINLAAGTYDISAKFEGSSTLEAVEINKTVVVNEVVYDIVAEDVNMTYQDGTSYEVQLVDGDGNAVALAGKSVKITISGKSYYRQTNADGIASLPINLKAGTYEITAEYNGKEITNTIVVNKA